MIIHTEWNDFKSINFKKFSKNKKLIIYDMRNIYSQIKSKKRFYILWYWKIISLTQKLHPPQQIHQVEDYSYLQQL